MPGALVAAPDCSLVGGVSFGFARALGPAAAVLGFLMMREVAAIRWDDADEAIPAFLTLAVMPFTCSITNGIGAGFLAFVVLRLLAGRIREVHPLMLGRRSRSWCTSRSADDRDPCVGRCLGFATEAMESRQSVDVT